MTISYEFAFQTFLRQPLGLKNWLVTPLPDGITNTSEA